MSEGAAAHVRRRKRGVLNGRLWRQGEFEVGNRYARKMLELQGQQ